MPRLIHPPVKGNYAKVILSTTRFRVLDWLGDCVIELMEPRCSTRVIISGVEEDAPRFQEAKTAAFLINHGASAIEARAIISKCW